MVTRLFAGIALVVVGAALVALGLLFLIAAKGELHRYLVAAGGLALGGALAGVGVRTFRRARASLPDALRADVLALARRRDGRVTEAELGAALGTRRRTARDELAALLRAGTCRLESDGVTTWYVFPELLPRLAVRRCRHCRTELPLDAALVSCPSCGGELRTGVETLARGDEELYSMDDER